MWFKNLLIYRFTRPVGIDPQQLGEQLGAQAFRPCSSQQPSSFGWVAPINGGEELFHANNRCLMLCARREEKILPAAVIKEAVEQRIEDIKEADDRTPGRKERMEIKDEVLFDLTPKAFSRSQRQYAYIDTRSGLLIIDSSSHKRAEELMTLLRESLGSLPVIPIKAKNTAHHAMTDWLKAKQAPKGFELGGECELIDASDESAMIRCKNQALGSPQIAAHLDDGMFVRKLALSWAGGIEFLVDEELSIKRLRFADLIMDKAGDANVDTAAAQFDVDFAIMNGELANFIPALLSAFGGEDRSELDAEAA